MDVQEGDGGVRYLGCVLDVWVKVMNSLDEFNQLFVMERCETENVINVSFVKYRGRFGVLLKEEVFCVTHKETSIAWTHFCTHGDSLGLMECAVVESKSVERKDEFSETEKCIGRGI